MLQINNIMGYLSPQKNFKNTEVITKKILLKLRQSSLPDHSRKNFIIMKGLIRVSNETVVKQRVSFYTNFDFTLQPVSYKTKRTETRTDKDITRSEERTKKEKTERRSCCLHNQFESQLISQGRQLAKSILELDICQGQFLNFFCHKFIFLEQAIILGILAIGNRV